MNMMTVTRKIPEHQAVYERVRDMILLGMFSPGEALTIQGLASRLEVGVTPVREAIRRLTAEQALETLGNRRVAVPEMTAGRLEEIYFLRMHVEPELTQRAAKNISSQQVVDLREIDRQIDEAIALGDPEAYLERNNLFHFTIYRLAGSAILFRTVQSLWVQAGPALRVVCGRYGTANLPDKHSPLLDALERGDGMMAATALREDLEQGLELVRDSLPVD